MEALGSLPIAMYVCAYMDARYKEVDFKSLEVLLTFIKSIFINYKREAHR